MSPNGGSARMPQAADPGVGDTPAADKTEQILAAVQSMQNSGSTDGSSHTANVINRLTEDK